MLLSSLPVCSEKACRPGEESSWMELLYGVIPAGLYSERFRLEVSEVGRQFFVQCCSGGLVLYTVKRPILKSSLMRQIAPLEYISTLLKRSI
jgi:hypothetical protein